MRERERERDRVTDRDNDMLWKKDVTEKETSKADMRPETRVSEYVHLLRVS